MAGIYFHIPFCKQACHYCDFHFSTSLKYKSDMVAALVKELDKQQDYLAGATIETIYFGGGTPSLLSIPELESLLKAVFRNHVVADDVEITLEANPDDLTGKKLGALKKTPINRLSIGVQSFEDADLKFMNRAHVALEAERCIDIAQAIGFENLTVDLIYGSPTTTDTIWKSNIEQVLKREIPHISCYCLTVEPRTALDQFVKSGKAPAVNETQAARQFEQLVAILTQAGYLHYEISNFAQPKYLSRHNSNYWKGVPYLGIGPSAHSFNGLTRQWNIAHNAQYIQAIQSGQSSFELEVLTPEQHYNEYVMTGLRTMWGCNAAQMEPPFQAYFLEQVQVFLQQGLIMQEENTHFRLTSSGKLMADRLAMELFWVE